MRDAYPTELRAAYKRLTDIKLQNSLMPEKENELAALRDGMNRIDQTTEAWRRQERASAVIDRKLAELRCEIEAELERSACL